MPKEYTECVKSYVAKGKPLKDAKRICAIAYYKKHGKTPEQAEGSSASFSEYELNLFEAIQFIDKALGTSRKSEKTKKQQK